MQWLKRLLEHGGHGVTETRSGIFLPNKSLSKDSEHFSREVGDEVEDLSSVDPEERAWVKWFNELPQSHKQLVETSLHHGICVRPDNFERLLPRLRSM
jgi:hypothetical protein